MPVRLGTWNLEGRWSPEHAALLLRQGCDVWLLTEVHVDAALLDMHVHRTAELMGTKKHWAAIASINPVASEPDPHRATASANIEGVHYMCSVLPWRSCGDSWSGSTLDEKQNTALGALQPHITPDTVWGGDWNQALEGSEFVGTTNGRRRILAMIDHSGMSVPTKPLGSACPEHRSIDHIAIPIGWDVSSARRVTAEAHGHRLSDHDAYVVDIEHC